MIKLFDRVKVNIPTAGTGDIEFGAAVSTAYLTPTEAGVLDGDEVRYFINDGLNFEVGVGLIKDTVATMERTVTKSKIGGVVGTSPMNLSGTAVLALSASAADILTPDDNLASVKDADAALSNLGGTAVGKAVFTSASSAAAAAAIGTARVARQTVLTSSGTYTPDPNLVFAVVEMVSGGCGAGGVVGTAGQIHSSGGGGSGGYMRHVFAASELSSPQTVTIGAGGNGGTGVGNGTSGGTTLFGSLLAVDGGTGGRSGSSGQVGVGGEGANNFGGSALDATTITIPGAPGGNGLYNTANANITSASGSGGSSVLGGGAVGVAGSGGVAGKNAPGWGGGGSGAISNGSGTLSLTGGNGKSGVILVTEFCSE